ncbi:hypothetical protein A2215_02835 [Candidatus Berkelbacteria bacterium RIFOXYA2_FULL_43_10]|uniref:GIY-YIG domain-containing protein n=1 Tax=Candidatus Berkelbacteria bacterium RIFOXYA2_FULL_43_10 TaxID=1797472 RepID=A0A1F5E849_9BACT|nr:MAG: hypothetical protein A2215_02835 [Candidatus Berkelbacteria bacterium RIFOXYA2_FULL_43_10]
MKEEQYYTYIATNKIDTVFYIGVTNDLERRAYEHKNKLVKGFTDKYNVNKIVYFEMTPDVKSAIAREKQLKRWHREWKINLIKKNNPNFDDLLGDPETLASSSTSRSGSSG